MVRSPHVHLGFHGVELIGRLLASEEARHALEGAPLGGVVTPNKPSGVCHYHDNANVLPLVKKSIGCGAPKTISLTSQGCQKQGQAAKIKGPVERGVPSLTCWLGRGISLTLNYFLNLRNWYYLHTL